MSHIRTQGGGGGGGVSWLVEGDERRGSEMRNEMC